MGNTLEDGKSPDFNQRENQHEENQKHLRKQDILMCIVIGISAASLLFGFMMWQNSSKQLEIETTPPIILATGNSIYLDRSYSSYPKHDFSEGIDVEPFSTHSLRIIAYNVTLQNFEAYDYCMFDKVPEIRMPHTEELYWNPGDPVKKIYPDLYVDYKFKSEYRYNTNPEDKKIRYALGSVIFDLYIIDLETDKRVTKKAYSNIIAFISNDEQGKVGIC